MITGDYVKCLQYVVTGIIIYPSLPRIWHVFLLFRWLVPRREARRWSLVNTLLCQTTKVGLASWSEWPTCAKACCWDARYASRFGGLHVWNAHCFWFPWCPVCLKSFIIDLTCSSQHLIGCSAKMDMNSLTLIYSLTCEKRKAFKRTISSLKGLL